MNLMLMLFHLPQPLAFCDVLTVPAEPDTKLNTLPASVNVTDDATLLSSVNVNFANPEDPDIWNVVVPGK